MIIVGNEICEGLFGHWACQGVVVVFASIVVVILTIWTIGSRNNWNGLVPEEIDEVVIRP